MTRQQQLEQCLEEQKRGLQFYQEGEREIGRAIMNDWLEEELLIRKEANDPEA